MAGATHRAGDPADLAARGGARAMDEPGSHPATRGRRGRPSADRTLQRTAAATPAPTVDRSPATLAAHGPRPRDAAGHLGRPCRRGKDSARAGRSWRHHPHPTDGTTPHTPPGIGVLADTAWRSCSSVTVAKRIVY